MSIKTTSIIAVMAILALLVSAAAGAVVTQDVEIRGTIMNGNGTCEYDYSSFAGFWYDLDKNHSSETMNITFTDERTIGKGGLVYECTPQMINYTNPYLLKHKDYWQYKIIGFMAEKYICYDNKTDQLVKLLINWGSSKDAILAMDDPMELPEGYMLSAPEIDLQGDKVWLKLYKDGECIDDSVIEGGDTYVYEDEDDVLQFSAQIESVFRGTESNLVVVKFVFMRSDDILDINGGDSFGVMEVKSTASTCIKLENDETITLDRDSEVEIMDGLYFKVADSTPLRYYLAKTICMTCPECPECPEPEPCPEVAVPNVTATAIVETPENETVVAVSDTTQDKTPDPTPTKRTLPGFEAVFAIAGLLSVAWLVLRQRE